MVQVTTIEFARAARNLTAECVRRGMKAPSFRSPPRLLLDYRSIRWSHGRAIISVRLNGRDPGDVFGDMIDGVMVANNATDPELRAALWEVVR